jgi:hypothetical protein
MKDWLIESLMIMAATTAFMVWTYAMLRWMSTWTW